MVIEVKLNEDNRIINHLAYGLLVYSGIENGMEIYISTLGKSNQVFKFFFKKGDLQEIGEKTGGFNNRSGFNLVRYTEQESPIETNNLISKINFVLGNN